MFCLPYSTPSRNSGRALTEYDVLSDRSPTEQYTPDGRFRGPMRAQLDVDPLARLAFTRSVPEPREVGPLVWDYDPFDVKNDW